MPKSRILVSVALIVGAAVLGVASISAGTLTSAYKPGLVVYSWPGARTHFAITTPYGAAPTAEVELLVPAAYAANLGQAVGTQLATISGWILDRGATGIFNGTIRVADPSSPSNACNAAGRDAAWTASLSNGNESLSFQIDVRQHPNQPTELHWCLPENAPQLSTFEFSFADVFSAPSHGKLLWYARFTPYDPSTGAVAVGRRVSARALVRLPEVALIHAVYARKTHRYVLTGNVSEGGAPVNAEVALSISVGSGGFMPIRHARLRSDADGNFGYHGRLSARHPVHFRAMVATGTRDLSKQGCPRDSANLPCVHSTLANWEKNSNIATIRP